MQKETALRASRIVRDMPGPAERMPRKTLAFHAVAARGEIKCIDWLIDVENTHPDAKDRMGNTALMLAARSGKEVAVGRILGKGAHVDQANADGVTALMLAAANGHEGAVRILLGHRAKAYLKDKKGKDAVMHAEENGHAGIASLIRNELGALNKALSRARGEERPGEEAYYICHGADPSSGQLPFNE